MKLKRADQRRIISEEDPTHGPVDLRKILNRHGQPDSEDSDLSDKRQAVIVDRVDRRKAVFSSEEVQRQVAARGDGRRVVSTSDSPEYSGGRIDSVRIYRKVERAEQTRPVKKDKVEKVVLSTIGMLPPKKRGEPGEGGSPIKPKRIKLVRKNVQLEPIDTKKSK